MSAVANSLDYEQDLRERVAEFRWDPLGAVMCGFSWGEGELAAFKGPRIWQCEELAACGETLAPRTSA